MKHRTTLTAALVCAFAVLFPELTTHPQAKTSAKVTIELPADTVAFKAGTGSGLASANCLSCHSAAYVYTQPPLSRTQWTAEVKKMKNVYAAPVADADVDPLVDYLMTQNGKT